MKAGCYFPVWSREEQGGVSLYQEPRTRQWRAMPLPRGVTPPGIKLTESGSFLQEALVPMLQLFSLGPKINREIPGREPGNSLAP